MTPLTTAIAIGAAFGLGFWLGGRWFLAKLVWSIANGQGRMARQLRAALEGGE